MYVNALSFPLRALECRFYRSRNRIFREHLQMYAHLFTGNSHSRAGRVHPGVGRGCGGYAEHGAVPAAGAAGFTRDRQRSKAVAGARQTALLWQRVQRPSRREAASGLSPIPRL